MNVDLNIFYASIMNCVGGLVHHAHIIAIDRWHYEEDDGDLAATNETNSTLQQCALLHGIRPRHWNMVS
jgi:hypothetical protein